MSYFKLLGYNVSKKLTGSANSLFSTAVIVAPRARRISRTWCRRTHPRSLVSIGDRSINDPIEYANNLRFNV